MKVDVTCRYGIDYTVELRGTRGEIARTQDMLSRCCCWCCYNISCKNAVNEKFADCGNVCEIWGKKFCENE